MLAVSVGVAVAAAVGVLDGIRVADDVAETVRAAVAVGVVDGIRVVVRVGERVAVADAVGRRACSITRGKYARGRGVGVVLAMDVLTTASAANAAGAPTASRTRSAGQANHQTGYRG